MDRSALDAEIAALTTQVGSAITYFTDTIAAKAEAGEDFTTEVQELQQLSPLRKPHQQRRAPRPRRRHQRLRRRAPAGERATRRRRPVAKAG